MNAKDKAPDYLYHYTTVDTLALILSNRTIRLNALNNMDDLQEQEAADLRNPGRFVYVSSWTASEMESIPMWKMYASLEDGVRIKLKTYPFKTFSNTPETFSRIGLSVTDKSEGDQYIQTYIPIAEMFKDGYFSPSVFVDNQVLLQRVEYSNDPEKIYPSVCTEKDGRVNINLGLLGKTKNKFWDFQEEWRYHMFFIPLRLFPLDESEDRLKQFMVELINGTAEQPFSYIDLPIDDYAFRGMEITLSPCMNNEKKELLLSMLEKYNPDCIMKESKLTGIIK